jgi:hypothetical protein
MIRDRDIAAWRGVQDPSAGAMETRAA